MKNIAEVYFGVYGDFDHADFSKSVGILPTQAWNQGQRLPERGLPKQSIWKYSSGRIESDVIDLYAISDTLVSKLHPSIELIREAITHWGLGAVLQTVLHISTDETVSTPASGFSIETIRFLSRVGASVDLDIYRGCEDHYNSAEQGAAANPYPLRS